MAQPHERLCYFIFQMFWPSKRSYVHFPRKSNTKNKYFYTYKIKHHVLFAYTKKEKFHEK